MATVALNVELVVDIPTAGVSSKLQKVTDSAGGDRTAQFRQHCLKRNLPLSTQEEIEHAAIDFVKAYPALLP